MGGVTFNWILPEVSKNILHLGCLVKFFFCQERPYTWRMSSILLRFLMVIMIVGVTVTFIQLDFASGFQKYIILELF